MTAPLTSASPDAPSRASLGSSTGYPSLGEITDDVRNGNGAWGGVGGVPMRRVWAMPSHDTFDVPPICGFVQKYLLKSKISVDPFARNKRWASYTNDLNPETAAAHHLDAKDFCIMLAARGVKADLVIFDPPYSARQVAECYSQIGRETTMQDTQGKSWSDWKSAIAEICAPGAIVLSFGWSTNGMGKKHGFEIIEILLCAHGGVHNDTICMAERRVVAPQADFFGLMGGGGRGEGDTLSTTEATDNV